MPVYRNRKERTEAAAQQTQAAISTPPNRHRLVYRLLLAFALLSFCFVYFDELGASLDALSLPEHFKGPGHDHGHHGHDHGKKHKPLTAKKAEKVFLSIPDEESALNASRRYATKPHLAGSLQDLALTKEFLSLVQTEFNIEPPSTIPIFPAGSPASQGATRGIPFLEKPQAWIDEYYPVMNTPLERRLQVVGEDGEVLAELDVEEEADETDPEAGRYRTAVPVFHGLSKEGDVTGKLVYANYGTKEDFDELVEKGVDLTGCVVIARYGGLFRGLKVKGAQEHGAAGILIFSDPKDDGAVTVENGYKPYPDGPARNPTSVQRGSVQFLSIYPGDPTTPGYPAYENATRTEGTNIPSIPSLPISWANAEKLLSKFEEGGEWEGKNIRLVNKVDTKVTPIWNNVAVIPGHIKDELVVIGNHRDAWVMGGTDATSGTVSMHEVVKGFGALLKQGWKPLRTIVIALWDAEEYGLIGSTEYVEDFEEFFDATVIAYLNLDSSVSGPQLSMLASPLLAHFLRQAALDLPHPTDKDRTLWDAHFDKGDYEGDVDAEVEAMFDAKAAGVDGAHTTRADDTGIGFLGSGSDFTAFVQRIGVTSGHLGMGATSRSPAYHYHSIYDSQRWQELYADPGFHRHVAVAKLLGLQTLRLASDVILPFNTTHYSLLIERFVDEVEDIVKAASSSLDVAELRSSARALQAASLSLDFAKFKAEQDLKHLVKRWKKQRSALRKLRRKAWKKYCKIAKKFDKRCQHKKPPHDDELEDSDDLPPLPPPPMLHIGGKTIKPRIGRAPAAIREKKQKEVKVLAHVAEQAYGVQLDVRAEGFPLEDFLKVLKEIRAVNSKLLAFERGFISPYGLKDREWYQHLLVAPGKWTGYGATTLPGLKEALTIDKDASLAQYELARLKQAVDAVADKIRVSE
ncbi:Zn-dependent exopeptidase [Schizophyllum commune Loenen D]|nr:Zn-dependent exopeptidase [Schizophyllum commune Loenen D]